MNDSLFVLHELGEQLKQQVDASAASAIQSDQLSLSQQLSALEQALCKQQTTLQVQCSYPVGVINWTFCKHLGISAGKEEFFTTETMPPLRPKSLKVNKLGSSSGVKGRWESCTLFHNFAPKSVLPSVVKYVQLISIK